jgi:hypothetical protein
VSQLQGAIQLVLAARLPNLILDRRAHQLEACQTVPALPGVPCARISPSSETSPARGLVGF